MSDNEYERFEITDYDLDNEFNINRPRRQQTKHQQIYGIWADDSDNDSGEEASTSRRGRGRRGGLGSSGGHKSKDYTAPVSFVAGGIQQAGKKKKADQPEDEVNVITDEESDDEARPAFGAKKSQIMADDSPHSSSDSSADEQVASSSKGKVGFGQQEKSYVVGSGRVGAWEQHTRGIGAKLLLQMGYKPGKGLGKDLQGISQPVEAHVRKGRGAIGAYGPEKAASVAGKPQPIKVDEDVREAKEFIEKLNKWKKNGEPVEHSKRRYYYKSVEEIIEKGQKSSNLLSTKLSKKLGNVPVIDMTGPERRVLSGYHALGSSRVMDEEIYSSATAPSDTKTSTSAKNFELPELMHNLQLIVDRCEQEIISIDMAIREGHIKEGVLEQEQKNLVNIIRLEQDHMHTLESAIELVEELNENNEDLTLERAEKIFIELQDNYAAEYKEFGLGDLAAGVIAPLVKNALEQWQPLVQPTQHVDLIKRWRSILQTDMHEECEARNVFDPYSSLIWAGVIPSFRACAAEWNPKKHQMMAALLDCWAPLFPTWILDSVLEQLVLPRLCSGVRDWDPLTDTVPIHIWILPWNSVLGHKMEEYIFPSIREKLGAALQAWMPQDRSARAMLTPWKGAFNEAEMQMFLIQHIIPKLQMVLNEFVINPLQQDLEPWNQVWEWRELIPTLLLAQLLDKYFFPKWMQVLVLWLNQSPDYAEISRWYSGWKNLLSEEILREPNIKEHFRRALEILHRATDQVANPVSGTAGLAGIPAPTMINAPPPPQPPQLPPSLMELQIPAPAQLDFKELVLQKCAERGIIFAPLPGRRELGKQLYRVGKLYCYIDRNVCMVSDNSFKNWTPSSVPQMMERAVTGVI